MSKCLKRLFNIKLLEEENWDDLEKYGQILGDGPGKCLI